MTFPTGRNLRQWKPWYKRYWLIRGRRREDKIARMVVAGVFLALAPVIFVLAAPSSPAPVYIPVVDRPSGAPDPRDAVLALVNAARARVGCDPLARQPQLDQAAQDWSKHMAEADSFVHRDLDELISIYGYDFSYAGENIAAGYPTPEDVMDGWMRSPGHRANILNCQFRDIGIGVVALDPDDAPLPYGWYWTQNFGAPMSMQARSASAESDTTTRALSSDALPPGLVAPAYPPPE